MRIDYCSEIENEDFSLFGVIDVKLSLVTGDRVDDSIDKEWLSLVLDLLPKYHHLVWN